MGTRIEIGDPVQYADVASQILQAAWKPPCLHYSAEYLAWQFSFPSEVPKRAAIAFLDNRPVGCIAVTARRFRYGQVNFPAYVLSFVAVDPSAARRGLGAAMYASLLDALAPGVPVVAFADPHSVGERLLLDSFSRAAFRHHSLRTCRAVGFLQRTGAASRPRAFARETMDSEEFAGATRAPDEQNIVWTDVTQEHWHHYRRDPRGRVMLVVDDDRGRPIGTAMFVNAQVKSPEGLQTVPMLESVALTEYAPDAPAALFGFAAMRSQPGSTVVASNLSCVDIAAVRASGARLLPSSFNTHAFVRGQYVVFENIEALNLEVT